MNWQKLGSFIWKYRKQILFAIQILWRYGKRAWKKYRENKSVSDSETPAESETQTTTQE